MKSAWLILAMMLGAGLTAASPAGQAVPSGTTITGTVTRFGTGEPLADVQLTLYTQPRSAGAPSRSAVSGRDGRFVFNDVAPGSHTINAALDGYFPPPNTNLQRAFTIAAGQARLDDIHFELVQGAAVSGQILTPEGQPAAELFLHLFRPAYKNGQRSLEEQALGRVPARTDDRGNFRIFSIEPGEYLLAADVPPLRETADPRQKLGKTFFPGTLDPASASLLTITPGADLRASFNMLTAPKFTISGTIINNIAGTTPGVLFFLVPKYTGASTEPPETVMNAKAGVDGPFELRNVQAGSYDLFPVARGRASSAGGVAPAFTVQIPVEVNQDVRGITAALQPDVDLKGRITFDPPLSAPLSAPAIGMRSAAQLPFVPSARAIVDAKGEFTFASLAPVQYQFWNIPIFALSPNAYVADIRQGAGSIMADGLVTPGSAEIQILVKADGGSVEGTVVNPGGKPAASVRVSLVPDPARRRNPLSYQRATTDDKGHFVIHGAAPGDYKIFAWPALPSGADESPEFIAKYENSGQALRIAPGASLQLQVAVQAQ